VQGTLTFVNQRAYSMFGYTEEDFERGLNCLEMLEPGQREQAHQMVGRVLTGEDLGSTEYVAQRKDGRTFPVTIHSAPIYKRGKPAGMRGIIVDISERKKAEEHIRQITRSREEANRELERSNRDLQEFTYTISHDLQEPLRKIHTFGQFLLEDCGDDLPPEGREYVHRMQNATVRMKNLIQHLLRLARVGSRGGELEPVDSEAVAAAAADTLTEKAREGGGHISLPEQVPLVQADAVQLEQVFQNLFANALKSHAPGRPVRVEVSAEVQDGMVVFSVRDNGLGIEPDQLEKVFGIFRRLRPERDADGSGIGLALCKKIVERHGGRIWVESVVGEGSTFRFSLPMAEQDGVLSR